MNARELNQFWAFVNERQRVWYLKEQLQRPPPWSSDPILQTHWFTNMYRELDPGTKYMAWLKDEVFDEYSKDFAFWALFYRHIASNRHAMDVLLEAQAITPTHKYKPAKVAKALLSMEKPFGRAYNVWPFTNEPTDLSKAELVANAFGEIAEVWPKLWKICARMTDPQMQHEQLMHARSGIGPFVAYQAWIDLCMLGILKDNRNRWCIAGPGAVRGASIIWGHPLGQVQARDAVMYLHDVQEEHLSYDEEHWLSHPLYASDIQNCLCEYQKYVRVRDGGRPTRGYPRGT